MDNSENQPGDVKASFFQTLPGILTAAGSFIVAITGLLALFLQFRNSGSPNTGGGGPATNQIIVQPGPGPGPGPGPSSQTCHVTGTVYDISDKEKPVGLPDVGVAFVTKSQPNSPVHMTTTSLEGKFQFNALSLSPADFPLLLQVTYTWGGGKQTFQWDDPINPGSTTEFIYVVPQKIKSFQHTNSFRPILMHVKAVSRPE